jgi:hypothetical protein
MKKFFLFAAVAMMALVGCEKQVQSSLDFADVKKEAKISGQLGFWYAEPGGATNFIGLANQKIWFEVDATQYDADADAGAKKVYEAITTSGDSAGYFTITVMMGEKRVKGDLRTDKIRFEHKGKIFYFDEKKAGEITLDLIAGNNKVEQVVVNKDEVLSECVGEGQLKGKLVRDAGTLKSGSYEESGKVAAEGFTVIAHVTYKKNATENIVKDYIATTDKNGEFLFKAIPAYDGDGNKAQIEVKQKEASYREYTDNKWVETTAMYDLAKTDVKNIKINEVVDAGNGKALELTGGKATKIDPTTMTKKVKVKGEILRQGEKFDKGTGDNLNKINKLELVKTLKYTPEYNNGAFELIIKHKDGNSIIYPLKVDEQGKYEVEVAIYDAWAYDDITIGAEVKKFVYTDYPHYYWKNYKQPSKSTDHSEWDPYTKTDWYQDWTSKDDYTDHYTSQKCEGTYEGKTEGITYDGFFTSKVDVVVNFKMSADSKAALIGDGKEQDKMKDKNGTEYTIYGSEITSADY